MKYIDAEHLRKEVKRLERAAHRSALGCADSETRKFHEGKDFAYQIVGILIDSLQQEQPKVDLEEAVFKEWETTKEEYLAKSMDKVHLEMEIATYLQDWDDDDEIGLHLSTDNGSIPIELEDIRDLARHFAEWGAEHLKR